MSITKFRILACLSLATSLLALTACSPAKWRETRNTGPVTFQAPAPGPKPAAPNASPLEIDENQDPDRYFVVENIATEKLRVYERCTTGTGCAHTLILETDMVVGEDTPERDRRSLVGTFRIQSWVKFHEDSRKLYPSWIHDDAPALPSPGASLEDWIDESLIPRGYRTEGPRASFGWFTARIGPNAKEQWTHGTWGHGADGDKFIQAVRNSQERDPRIMSHGCSRVENQVIAFMHEILPPGTKLVKVYAKEALAKPDGVSSPASEFSWDWVLTKEGARTPGPRMSLASVKARNVPSSEVLDQGRFAPDRQPTVVDGNVYGLDEAEFRGVFLIDEGRFEDYRHPRSLERGGIVEKSEKLAGPRALKKQGRARGAVVNQ